MGKKDPPRPTVKLPPYYEYSGPPVKAVKEWGGPLHPPLTIVVPVRNRFGPSLRNCLRGIELQGLKDVEVIIADFGSDQESFEKTMMVARKFNCTVYRCQVDEVWSLSIARNIGIRRARGVVVCTLDADCILSEGAAKKILSLHKGRAGIMVASAVEDLPVMSLDKLDAIKLPRDYARLKEISFYKRQGHGALISAERAWWRKIRGFDERMRGWGAEDDDLMKRAMWAHVVKVPLEKFKKAMSKKKDGRRMGRAYPVLHQWHPTRGPEGRAGNSEHWKMNRAILKFAKGVVRNKPTWGCVL